MSSKKLARMLRKNQTPAEQVFWEKVRNRKFQGVKFLRQHPIRFHYFGTRRFFVADFYCAQAKLIIEIDGKIHEKQKEYDQYRTYLLNTLGFKVIRFTNDEILNQMNVVLNKLHPIIIPPL